MGKRANQSKRQSLRFSVSSYVIWVKTEFEDYTAELINISQGGCAIRKPAPDLQLDEKVLLMFGLSDQEQPMEIGAHVIRLEDRDCALKFTDITEEKKQQLVKYFAARQRQNSST